MANRKDDDATRGFKIPIEDATEENSAKRNPADEGEVEELEAELLEDDDFDDEDDADDFDNDGDDADDADDADEDDPDIVAQAEAVVGEAAADALAKAQAEAKEWQDRYMRLHAEWDTYRRRMSEQREEEKVRATEKLMENILPVLDDFERTVDYATENGETGLLDGVKAVQSKLLDVLLKGGLETIDPAGEAYDALEAQAVQVVPNENVFEETVQDVFQKGYKMGKKVLRAAMVTVTSGGPKRPDENKDETGADE